MVDIVFSHALEDCTQTQAQEKCLYLEAHASKSLSSALSAEVKDKIKMEYGFLERANLLWKVLEQMFGSSNNKRSSSNVSENISSSFIHIDQDQEEQSSVQKEEVKSVSLGKSDGSVSQIRTSGFGRAKVTLAEEEDFSTSSSDVDDVDDDTDDEYDDQELLLEF
jgi:hypothetical protein